LRAERKAGEILIEMEVRGERAGQGRPEKMSHNVTFSDLGAERMQSFPLAGDRPHSRTP
jgi:hypothetical protein